MSTNYPLVIFILRIFVIVLLGICAVLDFVTMTVKNKTIDTQREFIEKLTSPRTVANMN